MVCLLLLHRKFISATILLDHRPANLEKATGRKFHQSEPTSNAVLESRKRA
jgi:hypothetical protein